jgi:aminopeptidase
MDPMLMDTQLEKYADVLLWGLQTSRKGKFKSKDIILIRYELDAMKIAECLQGKILDMGMHPILRLGLTSNMERIFFEKANNSQLVFQPPGEKELFERLNGGIYVHAPQSLMHLSDIDPKKIG